MKVAIGGAPFEVRMVELPASGIWTIDESALQKIWDALGEALAELGYQTEGIVMPQIKAFIMEDPGYVEFYNACKDGSEQWREYNRKLHEQEHGSTSCSECAPGFIVKGSDGYVICARRTGAYGLRYGGLAYPIEYVCQHELLHVWEAKLNIDEAGTLTKLLKTHMIPSYRWSARSDVPVAAPRQTM